MAAKIVCLIICFLAGISEGLIQASSNNPSVDVVQNNVSFKAATPDKYDLEIDGIFYQFTSIDDMTLEVVGGENVYSGEIIIPDIIEYRGKEFRVTAIDSECFFNSSVTSVKLGNNISTIGAAAFDGSYIKKIEIPSSVRILGKYSFDNCRYLTEVSFLDGKDLLQFEGEYYYFNAFFKYCPIQSLYIGRDIKAKGKVFYDLSNALEITIGPTVTEIAYSLLSGASQITTLIIPASVVNINSSAFDYCYNLKYLYFEDGENHITCDASFNDLPIEYLYIGRNFNNSPYFNRTLINKIDIGEFVTSLISLQDLKELTEIKIPKNVEQIGIYWGCNNLRTIYCMNTIPPESGFNNVFDNAVFAMGTLYVPIGCVDTYKSSSVWHNFFEIKEYDENISSSPVIKEDELDIVEIFDINGHKLLQPRRGMNILKYSDGSVKKILQ